MLLNNQSFLKFPTSTPSSDPYWNKVVYYVKANGTNGSTVFDDSSQSPKAITTYGNAQISTADSKEGGSSLYTTNGYISANDASFSAGTGDFCYEFWFKTTATNPYCCIFSRPPYYSTNGFGLFINGSSADGLPEVWWYSYGGFVFKSSLSSVRDNQWHHLAFNRIGTTCRLFIDGILGATRLNVTTSVPNGTIIFGTDTDFGGRNYNGFIDLMRITIGEGRYSSNFNPETDTYLPDTYWNNVALFLKGNDFTDSSPSPKTLTVFGNTQISTAQSKYGGSSILFDGNGDCLTTPSNIDLDFGTGNFTVEFWMYATQFQSGTNNADTILDMRPDNTNGSYLSMGIDPSLSTIYININNSVFYFTSSTLSINSWYHIALSRNGTNLKGFVNGIERYNRTHSDNLTSGTTTKIGGNAFRGMAPDTYYFGYLDSFRITKGVARYTANFNPETDTYLNV